MSLKQEHKEIKEQLLKLSANDTPGVLCPSLPKFIQHKSVEGIVNALFNRPATDRVSNYSRTDTMTAMEDTKDRVNLHRALSQTPVGLSQRSRLPEEEIEDDLLSNCSLTENNNDNECVHSRISCSREFNEVTKAVNNSTNTHSLQNLLKEKMREVMVLARKSIEKSVGQRVSMLPANKKNRNTHGTK